MMVFSLAPALHGEALLVPKPRSLKPVGIRSPQIFPSLPFTPGRLYLIVMSVRPTRSPTQAFLFPPSGSEVNCALVAENNSMAVSRKKVLLIADDLNLNLQKEKGLRKEILLESKLDD